MNQRKYIRFCSGGAIFARPDIEFVTIGRVKDISMGGMAFEYISNYRIIIPDEFACDLIAIDGTLSLFSVPCRIAYRFFIASTMIKDDVTLELCKYGVAFTEVNRRQQRKLCGLIGRLFRGELK